PRNAGRNQCHCPIDVSIIGGNVGDEIPVEVQRGYDSRYDQRDCQYQQGPAEKLRTHFLSGDQGKLGFEEQTIRSSGPVRLSMLNGEGCQSTTLDGRSV